MAGVYDQGGPPAAPCARPPAQRRNVEPDRVRGERAGRVLATGPAGWTAAAIVAAVQQAGQDEVALDRPRAGDGAPQLGGKRCAVVGDVPTFVGDAAAMRSADAALHLADAVAAGAHRTPQPPLRGRRAGHRQRL